MDCGFDSLGADDDFDAVAAQPGEKYVDEFRVFPAERGRHLNDGDMASKIAVGLGQLHADRAAAQDHQVIGAFGTSENSLVGEIGHAVQGQRPAARPAAIRWRSRSAGRERLYRQPAPRRGP